MKRLGALLAIIVPMVLFAANGWLAASESEEPFPPAGVESEVALLADALDPTAMATGPPTSDPMHTSTPAPVPSVEAAEPTAVLPATPQPEQAEVVPELPGVATFEPNELGDILVLEYHAVGFPEARWRRTPVNLRQDLEYLLSQGYYPVNLADVVLGRLAHVPRGRRPIVLTFDDSSSGQFRYLPDGTLDPNCAVGVIKSMYEDHGDAWPMRATFFVLMDSAEEPGYTLFGQPELAVQKLRQLVDWGMEVGSHTVRHTYLSMLSPAMVEWELAVSQDRIEALLPGYQVHSLALPFGDYPRDRSILAWGYSELAEKYYGYGAAVRVQGGPAPSPYSPDFDPLFIPRVQAIQSELSFWFSYYERHPESYYVSAGGAGGGFLSGTSSDPLPAILDDRGGVGD
jgi:peptidoglycan/xylan/chitin deacetylase (PgdA/CDA1 family)